jgi:hypothetical protein
LLEIEIFLQQGLYECEGDDPETATSVEHTKPRTKQT